MKEKDEFSTLIRITSQDAMKVANEARNNADASTYRMAVRTIFAGAEGILWYAKNLARAAAAQSPGSYSTLEIAALGDEAYVVAENGTVKKKANFIPMVTSIRLVSKLMARGQMSNADFDWSAGALSTIRQAVAVRNRLTHPKSGVDLLVTEEEFHLVFSAWGEILAFALNTALEADKRLGTGMFPLNQAIPRTASDEAVID
ncbi:hypothetical protein [Stenotrophomonas indicatrix]|jgi:hypothetical protein|uniref:hypothetical protein n=1 Tax=Stenotrophomonas indicatrix TaxID=2045451 RepID=UPI0004714824|nr:hypothetical protein [Stenotrophomonas indicatrix]